MKAKIKPRIDLENRTRLEEVIPLSTPFIIFVDPSDSCNFQCKFCPTGNRALMKEIGRPSKVMDFQLYKKIIDDICEFDQPIKVLRLYKDGEPLLNPHFAKMIKYAKDKKCIQKIDTTTNASLLNPKINREIIEAGIDRINISIEGMNSSQYSEFSEYKLDFDKLVENIKDLYEHRKNCEIIIKINGDILSDGDEELFYKIFGDIADGVSIEHVMSCWPEFELKDVDINQEVGIYGQKISEVSVCPYPFYSFAVNSDGKVSVCFLDWSRKLLVGDVKEQSVKEIWQGKEMNEYRKMFLKKERKNHPICKDCGQLTHGMPDRIDEFADDLLKKMEN